MCWLFLLVALARQVCTSKDQSSNTIQIHNINNTQYYYEQHYYSYK